MGYIIDLVFKNRNILVHIPVCLCSWVSLSSRGKNDELDKQLEITLCLCLAVIHGSVNTNCSE